MMFSGDSPRKYRRIFVAADEVLSDRIKLSEANRIYVYEALRLEPGDLLIASDGFRSFLVRLNIKKKNELWADIDREIETACDASVRISLAFGCVRPDPIEQILRHCTELGVERFIPILFERCNRRPQVRKERWSNIINSACSQSGRLFTPTIFDPIILDHFLKLPEAEGTRIFMDGPSASVTLLGALQGQSSKSVTLVVGPEGGITKNEKRLLESSGFIGVSIGPAILRTETAAIVGSGLALVLATERDLRKLP